MDREDSNSPCNVIFIGPQQTPRAVRFVDASVSVLVRVREDGRKYAAAWSNEEGEVKERGGEGRCFRNFYARVLRFSGADHWKISRGRRCVKTVDPARMNPSFAAVAAIPAKQICLSSLTRWITRWSADFEEVSKDVRSPSLI